MKLIESKTSPLIIVDVQPAYEQWINFSIADLSKYMNNTNREILLYINGVDSGISSDTRESVLQFWYEYGVTKKTAKRFTIVDKGYGFLRSWMDYEYISDDEIVKVLKFMLKHGVDDSRNLVHETGTSLQDLLGDNYDPLFDEETLYVGWLDFKLLQHFRGANICGGGKNECLKEVMLMLDAYEIDYKVLPQFVYG